VNRACFEMDSLRLERLRAGFEWSEVYGGRRCHAPRQAVSSV